MNIKEELNIEVIDKDFASKYYVTHVIDQKHFFAHIYTTYEDKEFKTRKEMFEYLYKINKNDLYKEMADSAYEHKNVEFIHRQNKGWCIVHKRNWDGSKRKRAVYEPVEIKII